MLEEQERRQEKEKDLAEEKEQMDEMDDPSLPDGLSESERAEPIVEDTEEEIEDGVEDDDSTEALEEEDEEEPTEELAPRRGCFWGCLLPIIIVLAVCVTVILIVQMRWGDSISKRMRQRIIANTQTNVLGDLPEGMNDDEINEIKASFEKVKAALDKGTINVEILDETIKEYQDAKRDRLAQKKQAIENLMAGFDAATKVDDD